MSVFGILLSRLFSFLNSIPGKLFKFTIHKYCRVKYIVVILFFLSESLMAFPIIEMNYLIDTISPPPEFPSDIVGLSEVCVSDSAVYTSDIPLGCEANWYINNTIQSSNTNTLEVLWTDGGDFIITIDFDCDTNTFFGCSLLVVVNELPEEPIPIVGDTDVCLQSSEIYTTNVGEGEYCQWEVDGLIQPADSNVMTYLWQDVGFHNISVSGVNQCGLGIPTYLDVIVNNFPVVNLGNDTTIYEGQSLTLDAGNPGCTHLWSTGETTQTITVTQSGNYEVVVSNACGDVYDYINVDVIVEIKEKAKTNKLFIRASGNNIYINIQNGNIANVKVWDIAGKLVVDSNPKQFYYLPEKGIYLIRVITDIGRVFWAKIGN